LWIGCADARVPANELMGEGAGTVFVHRNVGNQVLNTDVSLMSTLQYAVDHLQVKRKKNTHTHAHAVRAVAAAVSETSLRSPRTPRLSFPARFQHSSFRLFFVAPLADPAHHRVRPLRLRRRQGREQQHELRIAARQLAHVYPGREAAPRAG
jgi:hypothetical protein